MGVLLEGSVLPCHLVNANRGTFLLLPLFLEHFSQYPLSFHTTMPLNHRQTANWMAIVHYLKGGCTAMVDPCLPISHLSLSAPFNYKSSLQHTFHKLWKEPALSLYFGIL